ncbi:MAG TPA: diacylglycerol kinase family protein [Terrimicrobiaceae bacterium]
MNKSQKILVILNPVARSERANSLREKIASLSHQIKLRNTSSPGDARALAARAVTQGYETIVAAGGDGTINEVVNGIAGAGAHVRFGILPIGTMNVFASELGIPQNNLVKAWRVIEEGFCRLVDLPRANEEYFVQLAGAGLDAEVVRQTTPDFKKVLGPMSYLLTLAQVAARQPPKIRIEPVDGIPREGSFALVGNGRFYGGPFVLFKDARLDDGLLDVLVFKNQSHWDLIRYFQAIIFGSHPALPDVEYFQSRGLRLTSPEPVPVEIDGELTGTLPYEFGFSVGKLRVLVPQGLDTANNSTYVPR